MDSGFVGSQNQPVVFHYSANELDRGPDLLGVCEVENKFVLDLLVQSLALPGRNYQVIHSDSPDQRGIDVAFIYDENLVEVPLPLVDNVFNHVVMRRTATRDIVQVTFQTKGHQRQFVLLGNHWPSRSGGQLESEAYRAIAGETLAYFHQRILEVKGDTTPVLAMGDFNDEPFNASLVDYALSRRVSSIVLRGQNPYFLDLMWPLMGKGQGTLYFDGPNLLDQFLINKNLLRPTSPFKVIVDSINIVKFAPMVNNKGQPIPFGGMGKPVNQNGFSDHFPIELIMTEAD